MGIASKKSDVTIRVIRGYEANGLLIPYMTDTSRGVFSDTDIDNDRRLRKLQKDHRLSLAALRFLAGSLPCWCRLSL
ncbi:MerR family transcriptional regulator [bacterium]|nr:MerR family transcriptional regulator [bacterium]